MRREGQFGDLSVVSPRPSSGHDHPPVVLVKTLKPGHTPAGKQISPGLLLNIARLLYISVMMHTDEENEEARTHTQFAWTTRLYTLKRL